MFHIWSFDILENEKITDERIPVLVLKVYLGDPVTVSSKNCRDAQNRPPISFTNASHFSLTLNINESQRIT